MNSQYSYALVQFNKAIYVMATGRGDIRSRMRRVFESSLSTISVEKLPPEAKPLWEKAHKIATKYDERYTGEREEFNGYRGDFENHQPGLYEATFKRVRKITAQEVAELICQIWDILKTACEES